MMKTDEQEVPKEVDVVIVGAGIGGLISGIECAKSGLKTIIIEQHFQPGGCCSSFRRKGFTFDAGMHLFAGAGCDQIQIGKYFVDLDLGIDFIKIDPFEIANFPKHRIKFKRGADELICTLKTHFPEEQNIDEFFKTIRRIWIYFFGNKEKSPLLEKYKDKTWHELLNEFFSCEEIKSILSVLYVYNAVLPKDISALAMAEVFSGLLFYGAYYPKGGIGLFANKLAEKFSSFGGELLLSCKVERFKIENNEIQKTIYRNKREDKVCGIRSKMVISNIDIRQTFSDILGKENKDKINNSYIDKIDNIKYSMSPFVTFLGVDFDKKHLENKNGLYFSSYNLNECSPLWITIPTLVDSSTAPEGKGIVQLSTLLSESQLKECFENPKSFKPDMESVLIKKAEEVIPNLSSKIIVKESATPLTFYRYTLNSNGASCGLATVPSQFWKNRIKNSTPINNLFLAGHWTSPAPGFIGSFISGYNVATKLIGKINEKH